MGQRSTGHPGRGGGALRLMGATANLRGTPELDLITADLALKPGVEVVLVAVAAPGGTVEVLSMAGATDHGVIMPPDFVGRAIAHGHTRIGPYDTGSDFSFGDPGSGAKISYAVSAPLHTPGGPAGVVCAGLSGAPPEPDSELMWTVDSYARLASLSLNQDGVLGGLFSAARHDELTGCINYAALMHELTREIERSGRHGLPLACCFIDLDRYKQINDQFGHAQGNRVLSRVGRVLRDAIRTGDTVGRYGGDEFVVVLPSSEARAVTPLAERMRTAIQALAVRGLEGGLDASIGIAQWQAGTGSERLLGDADRALTAAKAAGGGMVVLHQEIAAG